MPELLVADAAHIFRERDNIALRRRVAEQQRVIQAHEVREAL